MGGGSFTSARSCTNLPPALHFQNPETKHCCNLEKERKKCMTYHSQGGTSLFLQESVSNSRVLMKCCSPTATTQKKMGEMRVVGFFFMHTAFARWWKCARAVSPYIYLTTYRHAQCSQQQHQLHRVARNGKCCKICAVERTVDRII